MRIVKRWILLLLFGALCLPASSCRPLLKEVFRAPKVRLVDIGIAGNPFVSRGPIDVVLHLAVNNPNSYALTVASVAYSATVGTRTVADGERTEEIRIEPSGETVVRVPVRLQTDVFADALRNVLEARVVSYEFNGSVSVVAPIVGVVRVPFSRTGTIDPMDILRRRGIGFN
ncbi:LEA type 2 family protein [Candidatus Deferrimicrobium sp.]|uniref:LEA type 2 family protein n=1 Tax=Candidatus Deferrimicrobium sp. TaxID=3060586 RepID=UPI002ED5010C